MLALGYCFDAPLAEEANPAVPENPAKAPWYFLGLQELVSYSAFMGGVAIPAIVVIGLMLTPYLDRDPEDVGVWFSGPKGKRITLLSGLFTAIVAGFLISLLGGSRVQIGGPTGAFVVIVSGIVAQFGYVGLCAVTLMDVFLAADDD